VSGLETIDLTRLETFADGFPHGIFDWLRREAPVWWHPPTAYTPDGEGFWVVSRHADVLRVFLDPQSFSSVTGGTRRGGGTFIQDSAAAGVMLNMMDDPRHGRIRALINKGFTPRIIADLEGELRRRARVIVAAVADAGRCDFVVDVARELPLQAICMLLGVPQADRARLCHWIDTGLESADRELGETSAASRDAMAKLLAYASELIAEKRAHPGADVLSVVAHATLPDESPPELTEPELTMFFFLLFAAGSETTRKTIAGGLRALVENPDQLAGLRREARFPESAVEEMVRWTTPSVYKRRTLTRDLELGGEKLRAGDKLTIWEMSANRDEAVFAEPHRFDVRRSPNPHLGFGQGVHFCLGANLARLEIRVLFEELFARLDDFELCEEPAWTRDNRLFGLKHLPVRYTARYTARPPAARSGSER
jgi:cytochrome P450